MSSLSKEDLKQQIDMLFEEHDLTSWEVNISSGFRKRAASSPCNGTVQFKPTGESIVNVHLTFKVVEE